MTKFDLTYQKALPPFVFQNEKNMSRYDVEFSGRRGCLVHQSDRKKILVNQNMFQINPVTNKKKRLLCSTLSEIFRLKWKVKKYKCNINLP